MGVWSGVGLTNVGLALVAEKNPDTRIGPLVFSGGYCAAGYGEHNRFIIGTVWDDLDSDDEYDEGEGLGGVLVVPDHGTYYAITGAAGGYAIPVTSAGTYLVNFSGGELSPVAMNRQVVIGADSALLDAKKSDLDGDGDGVNDEFDAFPNDPTETSDRDNDGTGDNADDFPDDSAETTDTDGDGIGDNSDDYPIGHFTDVPPTHPAYHFIEDLVDTGITAGCSSERFCPGNVVTRAQIAVILERALHGSNSLPPAATGAVFGDVGSTNLAAAYIEHLFADGITQGCGNGDYCPSRVVTRDHAAIALLVAKFGADHIPPAAIGLFNDVPRDHWAAPWIEQLASEGISLGCDAGNYCPSQALTRDQLAVLLTRTLEF
jgi:hypothetical protein